MMLLAIVTLLASVLLIGPVTAEDTTSWIWDMKNKQLDVNSGNCYSKSDLSIRMPDHIYKLTLQDDKFNHMYRAVLNRAIFFSYILQKFNSFRDFVSQPNLDYYYLSASTSLASVPKTIAAGVYYDKNKMYPNFDRSLPFNWTVPLFGVRAVRSLGQDGTFRLVNLTKTGGNYTSASAEKYTPWYRIFLPDPNGTSQFKDMYPVDEMVRDASGFEGFKSVRTNYFGPATNAVQFTQPYFDCLRTNKWIVTAVAPIFDILPRYTGWKFLQKPRAVAVSAMDIELDQTGIESGQLGVTTTLPDQARKRIVNHFGIVNNENCRGLPRGNLSMPDSMITGKDEYFYHEMREAERLANFVSGVLRVKDVDVGVPGLTILPVNKDQLFGEVMATVKANPRIIACGIFFDRNKTQIANTEYFAPTAWDWSDTSVKLKDVGQEIVKYTDRDFFVELKSKSPRENNYTNTIVGTNPFENDQPHWKYRPSFSSHGLVYPAAEPGKGLRSDVNFDCSNGFFRWMWNYTVPITRFLEGTGTQEFAGVAQVTIRISPSDFVAPEDRA